MLTQQLTLPRHHATSSCPLLTEELDADSATETATSTTRVQSMHCCMRLVLVGLEMRWQLRFMSVFVDWLVLRKFGTGNGERERERVLFSWPIGWCEWKGVWGGVGVLSIENCWDVFSGLCLDHFYCLHSSRDWCRDILVLMIQLDGSWLIRCQNVGMTIADKLEDVLNNSSTVPPLRWLPEEAEVQQGGLGDWRCSNGKITMWCFKIWYVS